VNRKIGAVRGEFESLLQIMVGAINHMANRYMAEKLKAESV